MVVVVIIRLLASCISTIDRAFSVSAKQHRISEVYALASIHLVHVLYLVYGALVSPL